MALTEVDVARLNDDVFAATGTNKNRIINGDMRIDQRNAGASVTITSTTSDTYTLDRWAAFGDVASKFSVQQNVGSVTPPSGFTSYLGVTSLSAYTPGVNEAFIVYQKIEGYNVADLNFGLSSAQSITLSFWVRSSLTGTFGGSLRNENANRSYPFSYTISAANTWEQKTITISGDTTGTWNKTNGKGIELFFSLGCGSSKSGTAGSWAASSLFSATGATSVVGTNGATFYITGVQVEAGDTATPFERRNYGQELSLCQRYFYSNVVPGNTMTGFYNGSSFFISNRPFPVPMRTTPTLVSSVYFGEWVFPGVDIFSAYTNHTFSLTASSTSYGFSVARVTGNSTPAAGSSYCWEQAATFQFSSEL